MNSVAVTLAYVQMWKESMNMATTEKDAFERGKEDFARNASCPYSKLNLIRAWNTGRAEAERNSVDLKSTQEYKR